MVGRKAFHELQNHLLIGTDSAAEELFQRFAAKLIKLAEQHVDRQQQAKFDGEDVVQSVLRSFFVRQEEGQFELTIENCAANEPNGELAPYV